MSPVPVIRRPGQVDGVTIGGPMAFLVTGEHTQHTSMFEWTIPAGFATGTHVHRIQEETFYVLDGLCEWWVGDERGPRGFDQGLLGHRFARAIDQRLQQRHRLATERTWLGPVEKRFRGNVESERTQFKDDGHAGERFLEIFCCDLGCL